MGGIPQAPNAEALQMALQQIQSELQMGNFGAACVKLSKWNNYELRTHCWSYTDAALERDETLLGWGFSLAYRREAWLAVPFKDMGLGEDYDFVLRIMEAKLPVALMHDSRGICAHVVHADNTTG